MPLVCVKCGIKSECNYCDNCAKLKRCGNCEYLISKNWSSNKRDILGKCRFDKSIQEGKNTACDKYKRSII